MVQTVEISSDGLDGMSEQQIADEVRKRALLKLGISEQEQYTILLAHHSSKHHILVTISYKK